MSLKEYGYCIHLATGEMLGDMCEACCDEREKQLDFRIYQLKRQITKKIHNIVKGVYDPVIQYNRFAKFYFGLNVIAQECVEPSGIIKIQIPFLKKDIAFIRYKKFIPAKHSCMVEKRLGEVIGKYDSIVLEHSTERLFRKAVVDVLKYIRDGSPT